MVMTCCAYGCRNRFDKTKGIHFFGFPLNDDKKLQKWKNALKRKGFQPTKFSKVCSDHFLDTDYLVLPGFKKKKLKEDAVPSVFTEFPEHLKKKPRCPRTTRTSSAAETECHHSGIVLQSVEQEQETEVGSYQTLSIAIQTDLTVQEDNERYDRLQKNVKALTHRLIRQKATIGRQKQKIIQLKRQKTLPTQFEGTVQHIFQNEVRNSNKKNNRGRRYTEEIKQLALTLHYTSAASYKVLRKTLCLPHPSTIALWTSSVNAEPGFLQEVIDALIQFPDCDRDTNLVIDAMSIKKGKLWDSKMGKYVGFVDYGNRNVVAANAEASEALFFMLVSLNGKWKIPIAYFLINKVSASVQGELINCALTICFEKGIRVRSLTFDGAATNLATAKYLRANSSNTEHCHDDDPAEVDELDVIINGHDTETETYTEYQFPHHFSHPRTKNNVYIILDPCHMVKLARNALAAYSVFKSPDGLLEWRYIKNLHNFQEQLGFRFGNKLTKTHIDFYANKMKVKYAVQSFSSSVADAIDFLRSEGVPEFQGSESTTLFIRTIDRIFDFLNSRNPFAKGYKKAIFPNNIQYLEQKIESWIQYLNSLKTVNDVPLYLSRRKCFVLGFAASLKSILQVSKDLLCTKYYKYVLTYKFSQDHIELLFGTFRLRLGCNNNPNALQLKYIVKKVLLKNSISISSATNCTMFDHTGVGNLFNISTRQCRKKTCLDTNMEVDDDNYDIEELCTLPEIDNQNTFFKENIMFYVAGYIVYKLLPRISCRECSTALVSTDEHYYSRGVHTFTVFKDRGGLRIPSPSVFRIVRETEKNVQFYSKDIQTLRGPKILYNVRRTLLFGNEPLFPDLKCDECDIENNPKVVLLILVCKRYLRIRLYSLERSINDRISIRNKLLKSVLFKNL